MDTDFSETQTCFSHKMKKVNRHFHQWNIGIKIRSIKIIFNKGRAGSKLFGKHRWGFIYLFIKGLGSFKFFKRFCIKPNEVPKGVTLSLLSGSKLDRFNTYVLRYKKIIFCVNCVDQIRCYLISFLTLSD